MDGREATRLIRKYEDDAGVASLSSSSGPIDANRDMRPAYALRSPVCIIALSGNARPGQMQTAYDTGLDDYLTKPCSQAELQRMLAKWERIRAQ